MKIIIHIMLMTVAKYNRICKPVSNEKLEHDNHVEIYLSNTEDPCRIGQNVQLWIFLKNEIEEKLS